MENYEAKLEIKIDDADQIENIESKIEQVLDTLSNQIGFDVRVGSFKKGANS
tara:strand:+ start:1697 stop:1852 length:156 start_codon:yes stop_codon:yes gene_type:complete